MTRSGCFYMNICRIKSHKEANNIQSFKGLTYFNRSSCGAMAHWEASPSDDTARWLSYMTLCFVVIMPLAHIVWLMTTVALCSISHVYLKVSTTCKRPNTQWAILTWLELTRNFAVWTKRLKLANDNLKNKFQWQFAKQCNWILLIKVCLWVSQCRFG